MSPFLASIFASTHLPASYRGAFQYSGAKTIPPVMRACAVFALLFLFTTAQALAGHRSAPIANNDSVSTGDGQYWGAKVLENDSGLDDKPITLTVVSQPSNGSAWPMSFGGTQLILLYTHPGSSGRDTFVYQISDANGDKSVATVHLDISCTNQCATVSLGWDKGPASVTGYRVFFGPSSSTATQQVFDALENSVSFNAITKLGLSQGDPMCFRVKAYNAVGESDFSDAICSTL